MRFVQKVSEDKYDRYICPECGSTVATCDKGDTPIIPDYCSHCGHDLYYVEENCEDCKIDDAE